MATPSTEFARFPFENVRNLLGVFPQGHEKALKHAFYNALALVLLVGCGGVAWASLVILEPFVKPLIWALLCGSVLHPLKRSLATNLFTWLENLEASSAPVLFVILMTPVKFVDRLSERIGNSLSAHLKVILLVVCTVCLFQLLYYYTPHFCVCFMVQLGKYTSILILWIIQRFNTLVVVSVVAAYLVAVTFFWKPDLRHVFSVAAHIIWVCVCCFLANQTSVLQLPAFFFLLLLLLAGLLYEVWLVHKSALEKGSGISLGEAMQRVIEGPVPLKEPVASQEVQGPAERKEREEQLLRPTDLPLAGAVADTDTDAPVESQSDVYLYGVAWACAAMVVWKNSWLLQLVPVLLFIYVVKRIGHSTGLWQSISGHVQDAVAVIGGWCEERRLGLLPPSVSGIVKIGAEMNASLLGTFKEYVDSTAAVVVIFGLIIFTTTTTIFIAVQVYAEGLHMVQVSASIVNSTLVHNEELMKLLPQGWEDTLDTMLDNAYLYGRDGISRVVRSWLEEVEEEKAVQIEKQLLELWDRVYQAWMMSGAEPSAVGPSVSSSAVFASWENMQDLVQKTPELFNVNALIAFAKENLQTVVSVLESVWAICKGNLSLALYSFTALVSVIFGSGFAVLNFLLNVVVFLTALFYLLSSSGEIYKPVDLLTNFNCNRLAVALEEAINDVFKASFKLGLFYGLWTWFVHNLFQVQVVYLPAVLAAVFGAVPFVGTYWAGIPAAIDLWLIKDSGLSALLLMACHFLPTSIVNTAFYMEIKGGGHPYLTGLAIAGGIFCLGFEGALVGPMVLCVLFVAINMSTSILKESPVAGQVSF
ncbi:transmembrane protein 245 [Bacillus rossius redtenbacheri]|uniref:transmembrane protein 245 n=1 Tax=Bacillus rossius redtenbacheri TaxID=93214 RepID=UPI002FDCC1A7